MKKDYILIDSSHHLEYFICELKDKYIPIAIDTYAESFLESRGIETIGILDYLSDVEIKAIISAASSLVDVFVARIDESNRELYGQIFGREDVNLVYASMNYYFKRFVIATFKFLKGLEAIIEKRSITYLAYLHDGSTVLLCTNREQNAFFFPDDIVWRIMQHWNYGGKPRLSFIKAPKREMAKDLSWKTRAPLGRAKRLITKRLSRYLYSYSPHKKNLLLMSPLYDLSFLMSSAKANREYNIISWDVDRRLTPKLPGRFLGRHPRYPFVLSKDSSRAESLSWDELIEQFDLYVGRCKNSDLVSDFQFASFAMPLVKQFLEDKLPDVYRYWKVAENLHNVIKIDALFWGNPPVRYPGGIVKEFFRLNEVPIVGMQHGGIYGSNHMGSTIFDLDFDQCNYWFSYGFDKDAISEVYPDNKLPEIIPVGSTRISNLAKQYGSTKSAKHQVKILYPVVLSRDNFFYESEHADPRLFHFQKQIIDTLALFNEYRIVLKFPIGTYAKHYLRPYVERAYPDKFQIVDGISFTECLKRYDVGTILIELQSTPLNEAVVTSSTIIVYDDKTFVSLMEEAASALSKRAIICNTREEFFSRIIDCMHDGLPPKDLENREYLEKYCIYKRNPEDNILESIRSIMKAERNIATGKPTAEDWR